MKFKTMFLLTFFFLAMLRQTYGTEHSMFENQQVWSVMIDSQKGSDVLYELTKDGLIDILQDYGNKVHFRVFPESSEVTKQKLTSQNYQPVIEVMDLPRLLRDADETNKMYSENLRQATTCTINNCSQPLTNAYMTFQQMEWYLKSLASTNPQIVKLQSLGKTKEGRDIWMVKVNSSSVVANKSVWIEGGIHAREWIASAVALHLLNNVVKNSSMTVGIDYYFVPMANPDGFVYTQINRMWRKNRGTTASLTCPGVDLNRNWNFHWGVGASTNPCSDVYQGSAPFSQPETKVMSTAITGIKNLRLSLAIHSYSQLLLYGWGWTGGIAAPDTPAMVSLGTEFVNAVYKVNKNTYKCVNTATGLYLASGTTDDWVKGTTGIKYSYTLELGDTGTYGFLLPASKILPSTQETWAGFLVLINRIRQEP